MSFWQRLQCRFGMHRWGVPKPVRDKPMAVYRPGTNSSTSLPIRFTMTFISACECCHTVRTQEVDV